MFTFKVVKEEHGWAVRMEERMTTPFWSRDLAVREARCLADAICRHGEQAEVIVEIGDSGGRPETSRKSNSTRWEALLQLPRAGRQ
jgi:hypothetical protein